MFDKKLVLTDCETMSFDELKAFINAAVAIRKSRKESEASMAKDSKAEAKVLGMKAGLAFIKTKTIGDVITYKTAEGGTGLMKIKNIKLETQTVSGTKIHENGNIILNDAGKPAGIWRYFYQLDYPAVEDSAGEDDESSDESDELAA